MLAATPKRRKSSWASDAELLSAVADGDAGAIADVRRLHIYAVAAAVRRVVFDRALSEEVVQDVFVELWRQPARFDPDRGTLRTYLTAVARNRAIDVVRAEHARALRETRWSKEGRSNSSACPDVEGQVIQGATAEELLGALWTLPPKQRIPVVLAFFGGRSYRQVAQDLGLAEGTVKSQISAGLRQLATALKGRTGVLDEVLTPRTTPARADHEIRVTGTLPAN